MNAGRAHALFLLVLALGMGLRAYGLTRPWGGADWHTAMGTFAAGAYGKNFADHGFLESGLMPYRWRVELADGSVERSWYAHHPPLHPILTGIAVALCGAKTWAVHVPGLLFSLLSLFACRRLARALGWGERRALLSTGFFALLPMGIFYGVVPWAEPAIAWVHMEALAAYARWWRTRGRGALAVFLGFVVLGGLLDWPAHFLLPGLCLHLLVASLARGEPRRLLLAVWAALAAFATVVLHWVHYSLVAPERTGGDTAHTLEWVTTLTIPVAQWLDYQRLALVGGFGAVGLALLAVGLARQIGLVARRRRAFENGLLLVLAGPPLLYVGLFPARSTNHEFFWYLALPWAALTAAGVCGRALELARRAPVVRPLVLALVLALLGWSGYRGFARWRAQEAGGLGSMLERTWVRELLAEPSHVVVAGAPHGMLLHFFADASLISNADDVRELQRLHERVLSRVSPSRPVYYLFDRTFLDHPDPQLSGYVRPFHAFLGEHGTLVRSDRDALVPLELFDLSAWALGEERP